MEGGDGSGVGSPSGGGVVANVSAWLRLGGAETAAACLDRLAHSNSKEN